MPGLDLFKEADRQLTICNACRYCEGYCPVFPAIEMRREFPQGDVLYLANLCHDCRACYYACMYTAPHEFSINIPKVMADVRMASYQRWSWPAMLSRSFTNRGVGVAIAAFAVALVMLLSVLFIGLHRLFTIHLGPGAFYQVIPYLAMVIPGAALFFYAIAVWLAGGIRFWLETGSVLHRPGWLQALTEAVGEALGLEYLKGGGPGCYYPKQRASSVRRIFHSLTSWGFLSAFVSTSLAAIYQDLFHWLPPYSLMSAPVIFGSVGGVALIIGTGGLISLKLNSDPLPAGAGASGLDYVFLAVLGLTSLSGLLTLTFRSTSAMGSMLTIHLGLVAALFLTAPYGKFVHFVYRFLALIRNRLERGQGR
jgi:citrate/tricarballylate utilization protein